MKVWSALLLAALASTGAAQEFPSKPVRIIVPFPAGGVVDPIARTIGVKAQDMLGQPIILEHRPGSGGVVAAVYSKQQPADGYTLFIGSTGISAINKFLYTKLPYDPQKDFTPITILGAIASVMVVPPSSPAKNVQELIAYGKSKPGGLSHATQGIGTPGHLIAEMFSKATGTPVVNIHYTGSPQAQADFFGGRIDLYFVTIATQAGNIRAGKMRALSIASKERSKALPDVPTVAEAGVPGIELDFWFGLFAPAGTPQPIVRRLYEGFTKAMRHPEVADWMAKQELTPPMVTPEQFAAVLAADIERLGPVVKATGAKAD
jgi:tripartite-type tricarboxylate transporter receptor subunit TctC